MTVDAPLFLALAAGLVLSGRLLPASWGGRFYAAVSAVVFVGLQAGTVGLLAAAGALLFPFAGVRLLGPARAPMLVGVVVAAALGMRLGAPADGPLAGLALVGLSYLVLRQVEWLLWVHESPEDAGDLRAYLAHQAGFYTVLAGPIVGFGDVAERVLRRPEAFTVEDAVLGLERLARGYLKVVVLAPLLREATTLERLDAAGYTPLAGAVWLYGFPIALYIDFAGYTDVVLGFARLAGQRLPENFDRPFGARNVQQFWQRWHMSFSTWARTFVFTPVLRRLRSGARRWPERPAQAAALLACFVFVGLWHGATASFLLFGVLHGLAVFAVLPWTSFLERRLGPEGLRRYRTSRIVALATWLLCFHFLCATIALFGRPVGAVLDAFARLAGP